MFQLWERAVGLDLSKLVAMSTNPFLAITPNTSMSPIPLFGPQSASPPKLTPPPQIQTNIINTYIATTPTTPDTPDPCYLELTLPTSSSSPQAQGKYNFLLKNTNIAFTGNVLQTEETHAGWAHMNQGPV